MKAITLYQPWATLMAIGAKRIETRSWATSYRGELAIHAGKDTWGIEIFFEEPFKAVLTAAGIRGISDLPLGQVVGVCELFSCEPTERLIETVEPPELDFGTYAVGRFGWLTRNMRRIDPAIPARGAQRLWDWDPQGSYREQARAQMGLFV